MGKSSPHAYAMFREAQIYLINPSFAIIFWVFLAINLLCQDSCAIPPTESMSIWARTCHTSPEGFDVHLSSHLPPVRPGVGDKDQATRESRV